LRLPKVTYLPKFSHKYSRVTRINKYFVYFSWVKSFILILTLNKLYKVGFIKDA